jgi:hypothetical protein
MLFPMFYIEATNETIKDIYSSTNNDIYYKPYNDYIVDKNSNGNKSAMETERVLEYDLGEYYLKETGASNFAERYKIEPVVPENTKSSMVEEMDQDNITPTRLFFLKGKKYGVVISEKQPIVDMNAISKMSGVFYLSVNYVPKFNGYQSVNNKQVFTDESYLVYIDRDGIFYNLKKISIWSAYLPKFTVKENKGKLYHLMYKSILCEDKYNTSIFKIYTGIDKNINTLIKALDIFVKCNIPIVSVYNDKENQDYVEKGKYKNITDVVTLITTALYTSVSTAFTDEYKKFVVENGKYEKEKSYEQIKKSTDYLNQNFNYLKNQYDFLVEYNNEAPSFDIIRGNFNAIVERLTSGITIFDEYLITLKIDVKQLNGENQNVTIKKIPNDNIQFIAQEIDRRYFLMSTGKSIKELKDSTLDQQLVFETETQESKKLTIKSKILSYIVNFKNVPQQYNEEYIMSNLTTQIQIISNLSTDIEIYDTTDFNILFIIYQILINTNSVITEKIGSDQNLKKNYGGANIYFSYYYAFLKEAFTLAQAYGSLQGYFTAKRFVDCERAFTNIIVAMKKFNPILKNILSSKNSYIINNVFFKVFVKSLELYVSLKKTLGNIFQSIKDLTGNISATKGYEQTNYNHLKYEYTSQYNSFTENDSLFNRKASDYTNSIVTLLDTKKNAAENELEDGKKDKIEKEIETVQSDLNTIKLNYESLTDIK